MRLTDEYTHDLLMAVHGGASLEEAMRDLTVRHADHLRDLDLVAVLQLEMKRCPRCGGSVLVGDEVVLCAAGCGFRGAA